jgi:hypothetical protein
MTFTGFNIKYPEYEVITPQTKKSFTLRSMNVQEEERLKGSLVTPLKVAEHLNSCIFDSLVTKPDNVTDLDSFLKTVTLKDRDALLYGLYHITYEEIRNYQVKCSGCSNTHSVTVQASSTFNFTAYPGADIIKERHKVELPKSKGVFVYVKQPTLFDELTAIRSLGNMPGTTMDLITETLIIDKFEHTPETTGVPIIYDDRVDIIDAYMSLPARDKRIIYQTYEDKFGKYGIQLKMKSFCPSCSKEDTYNIELVENFFRSLYSA